MNLAAKTDAAYRLIKRDILNGRFLPDEPLRLPALSALTGLSATPLREALSRLAEQGYVASTANCGWRVAGVSVAQVEDLARARLAIEGALLVASIAEGGVAWEAGIVAAHHTLRQVTPPQPGNMALDARQRWIAAHESFHAALVAGSCNATLQRYRAQIADQLQRHHQAILFAPSAFGAGGAAADLLADGLSIPRHTALMDAVLSRDPAAAEAALAAHVETTLCAYRSLSGALSSGQKQGEQRA